VTAFVLEILYFMDIYRINGQMTGSVLSSRIKLPHSKSTLKSTLNIRTFLYRVRQKYLTILQNSCECNRWRVEFVLERSSSETQSISVAMERWSLNHRAFTVETYLKNNDSVLTRRIFLRHFSIRRNECP